MKIGVACLILIHGLSLGADSAVRSPMLRILARERLLIDIGPLCKRSGRWDICHVVNHGLCSCAGGSKCHAQCMPS